VRETLIRVLAESRDDQTRSFALIALGQVGGRSGRPGANESGTRDCRNELLATLTRGRTKLRPWAAIGIGVMEREIVDGEAGEAGRSVGAESAVRSALREAGAPKDVAAYAIACGIAKDPDARSILREKLGSTNEDDVRGYVAVALGLAGARDALGDIQRIVKESRFRPALLKQAAIGLGLLGDKALVGDLVAMLGQAQGLSAQAAVASALGFIGDSRSIDPLVEMLRRREITSAARGFAAVALGIVADKEPLPWNSRISENLQYRASTSTLTSPEGTGILDIL